MSSIRSLPRSLGEYLTRIPRARDLGQIVGAQFPYNQEEISAWPSIDAVSIAPDDLRLSPAHTFRKMDEVAIRGCSAAQDF